MTMPPAAGRAPPAANRLASGLGAALGKGAWALTAPYRLLQRRFSGRRLWNSRADAVPGAAELAADEGLAKLAQALSDPSPNTRVLALDVICEFSEERAGRLISSMLCDPDATVRSAAADAAARVRASTTVFSLIMALEDEHPHVVSAASAALESITGRKVELEGSMQARQRQLDELKRWWKEQRVLELASGLDD